MKRAAIKISIQNFTLVKFFITQLGKYSPTSELFIFMKIKDKITYSKIEIIMTHNKTKMGN